jgi:hypothetical protein
MKLEELTVGESWACKFKVTTFVDEQGKVIDTKLCVGEKHPGKPGVYEGLGIIQIRDVENDLVKLIDVESKKEFCVAWENCWDPDTIEWSSND